MKVKAVFRRLCVLKQLKIYALLTVPNGDMSKSGWPGIVFNHGYIHSYPDDNHNLTSYFNLAMNQMIAFFKNYLR